MARSELGPTHQTAKRISDLEAAVAKLSTRDTGQNSSIGAGGLTIYGGGSIIVQAPGSIQLPTGTLSAGNVTASSALTGATLALSGNAVINGGCSINNQLSVSNNIQLGGSGTLYSTYLTSNPVVSSYVAVYAQSTDGRVGATPSARKFKRDIKPKEYTLEQLCAIEVVNYRLRAAYILYGKAAQIEVGVIAEQLIDIGLEEFVAFDPKGRPFSVHYERLALVALGALKELAAKVDSLAARLDKAGL